MQSGHQRCANECGYFLISNKEMILPKQSVGGLTRKWGSGILKSSQLFQDKLPFHISHLAEYSWKEKPRALLNPNAGVISNPLLPNLTFKWSPIPFISALLIWLKSALPLQFFCGCPSSGPHFLSPGPEQLMPTGLQHSIFSVGPQTALSIIFWQWLKMLIISES